MRKALIGLIAGTGLLLGVGVAAPLTASAQGVGVVVAASSQYICDGQGLGSCKSLPKGGAIFDGANLFAIGLNNGAWKWDVFDIGTVNGTFADGYIDNALNGQPILVIQLHDTSQGIFCNGNSDGGDILKSCASSISASEEWVSDPDNGYLVNVGRSNDKDNWEVLCNPGGGNPLIITTRDACTTYHEQWASAFAA